MIMIDRDQLRMQARYYARTCTCTYMHVCVHWDALAHAYICKRVRIRVHVFIHVYVRKLNKSSVCVRIHDHDQNTRARALTIWVLTNTNIFNLQNTFFAIAIAIAQYLLSCSHTQKKV
jgi:hypothetical protein